MKSKFGVDIMNIKTWIAFIVFLFIASAFAVSYTTSNFGNANFKGAVNASNTSSTFSSESVKDPPAAPAVGYCISHFNDNYSSVTVDYFPFNGANVLEDIDGQGFSMFNLTNTTSDGIYTDTIGSKSGGGVTWEDSQDMNGQTLSNGTINATTLNISGSVNSWSINNTIDLRVSGSYAPTGYGDDWNKTYADTLYADISVVDTNTNANTECSGTTTYYDGEGNCDDISSVYALAGYGDNWNKTYADTLYADISITGDDTNWNKTYADTLYRAEAWNNLTGIPHATPSNGDVTHFSLADEIYDWVIGLGYSTTTGTVTSVATDNTYLTGGAITTTGTITFNSSLASESLSVNSSDNWDNLGSPSDINAGDITNDGTYRLESWDNITGIPTATPSNGDTTHLSTADQIYDWVVGIFQPLEATLTDIADGTIVEDLINTDNPWADNEVSNTLTCSILTAAANQDIGAYNLTANGFKLMDNERMWLGNTGSGYVYDNGTALIIGRN